MKRSTILSLLLTGLLGLSSQHIEAQDISSTSTRGGDFPDLDTTDRTVVEHFQLFYRLNGTQLDTLYLDNRVQMVRISRYLATSPRIDSIVIRSYASPEGPYRLNARLAQRRAETARNYLLRLLPAGSALDPANILLRPVPENWEGLTASVEAGYDRPDRDRVLEILHSGLPDETKKSELKRLDGGRSYAVLLRDHMPQLRTATWICTWAKPELLPAAPAATFAPQPMVMADLPKFEVPQPIFPPDEYDKRTIVALKTNMLYDLATVLNIAAEFPITEHFSILYEHHFPWWLTKNNKYCLQFLSFGGEVRWWFRPQTQPETAKRVKRDALLGHFLGLYVMGGKLDLQARRTGCYQAEFLSAGLSYGYSMPIARRLNLEFSLSAGWARIPYRHYNPTDDYELLVRDPNKTGTWNYFGPTKAEIALVVPLLVKYKKKGGVR